MSPADFVALAPYAARGWKVLGAGTIDPDGGFLVVPGTATDERAWREKYNDPASRKDRGDFMKRVTRESPTTERTGHAGHHTQRTSPSGS